MSLEKEFTTHWVTSHRNMDRALTLLGLYPDEALRKVFKDNEESTADLNKDFIRLLKMKDKRILRIFNDWKHTDETGPMAEKILEKGIGGPLVSSLTYTYWKYADVVRIFGAIQEAIRQQVLLDQAIVASCTAYERFLKDMIPWVLKNHKPAAKAFLGRMNRAVKELGRFDFDPLRNVDAIFIDEHQRDLFPVFPEVVAFFKETLGLNLFPSEEAAKEIERIFDVRHCIVHNAGDPDDRWKRKTKGAEFNTDLQHAGKYVTSIHAEMHNAGVRVFELLNLDRTKAPFLAADPEPPFRWELTDAVRGPEAK